MKKRIIALCLALVVSVGVLVGGSTPVGAVDGRDFLNWIYEEGTWRAPANRSPVNDFIGGFITDASGRPSMEDLELILDIASMSATARGRTDWYIVAILDTDQQNAAIGYIEEIPRATSDGTVTLILFSERLLREEYRTDDVVGFYPCHAYINVGIVAGHINMAAFSLGYATRMFLYPAYANPGFREGQRWLETEHYLADIYYTMGTTGELFSAENMKYAVAIVIGTLDHSVESGVTQNLRPRNWSIWEPREGAAAAAPAADGFEDGVFTGTAPGYFRSPLTVEVTVEGGVIVYIEVIEHRETDLYLLLAGTGWGDTVGVIPRILETQGIEGVDMVAGATGTSRAIIRAVAQALGLEY